ncbi:MAG TPA: sugar phosphate isomerase/epimerase family protein [Acidobacteriota bacterium]
MFDDLFIRVASERLAGEADAIAALDAGPEMYIRAEALGSFTPQAMAATRRILTRFRKHTVHAPFMDVWPGAADGDVRRLSLEKMKRTMGIAAELGSMLVVMHFNYDPIYYRQQFPQWLERAACFFSTLLAEHDGPLIALENIAEPTPYIVLQLLKKAGQPRLVHCFDFGHHHVFARIPFAEWLFYLAPQGHIHFHLHDNPGDFDDHMALGQGSIDWQEVKATIAGLPCPFSIALEPKSPEIMRASGAYYRKHFLAARTPAG